MKKAWTLIFLFPLMFAFSGKNTVKTVAFSENQAYFAVDPAPSDPDSFKEYWENDFRENNPEVCNISLAAYKEMYGYYQPLSDSDKAIINAFKDAREPDYTIGQIIRTLVNKFEPNNSKMRSEKQKLEQSDIIVIATVVALVGATAISVLYILRNNKVIK